MEKLYNDTTGGILFYGAFNFSKNVKHLQEAIRPMFWQEAVILL